MCDVLTAQAGAAAGGEALWAKNSDRPWGEPQLLEWSPPRRDRTSLRTTHIRIAPHREDTLGHVGSRPAWGWGLEHGVNVEGVAIGNLSVFTTLDPRPFPDALTGMDLVRVGLERGATAPDAVAEVVEAIDRYGQGGSGHEHGRHPYWSTFVVADASCVWVLDTSGSTTCAEEVGPTWASSNRCALPAFDALHRHPRQPVERLVYPRLRASEALLSDPPVTPEGLRSHLRSHRGLDGYSPCMHVPGVEETTASIIVSLPADGPARLMCAVGAPCASIYVPLGVGPVGPVPSTWPVRGPLDPVQRSALDSAERELWVCVRDDPGVLSDPAWPSHAWELALDAGGAWGRQ